MMIEQKYSKEKIRDIVHRAYPDSVVLKLIKRSHYHSITYHLSIFDNNANEVREILLKKYHTKPFSQTSNEYFNQELFYYATNVADLTAPKPILIDEQTNSILMEFVNGKTVKSILLSDANYQEIFSVIDRCAMLLNSFHKVFKVQDDAKIKINSPYIDTLSQDNYFSICNAHNNVNLDQIIIPFLDYAPWNIINSGKKYYLIDFPEINCVCTPHIDIARFIFCINLINHTPNVCKLKMRRGWDFFDVCNRFLKQYLDLQNVELNDDDIELINFYYKQYSVFLLKKLMNSLNPIEKLQYNYLNNILKNDLDGKLLEKNDRSQVLEFDADGGFK